MHLGVQRLDTAFEDFGLARVAGDLDRRDPGVLERRRGPAGRQERVSERGQLAPEIGYAGLVEDAEERALLSDRPCHGVPPGGAGVGDACAPACGAGEGFAAGRGAGDGFALACGTGEGPGIDRGVDDGGGPADA